MRARSLALALLLPSACATVAPAASGRLPYPEARRTETVDVLHGVRVADPYRWLEDGGAPEVRAWTLAQDRLARAKLRRLPGVEALAARARDLTYVEARGVPVPRGARLFYERRHPEQEKAVLAWRDGEGGPENVLLDPNAWSADGSISLGGWTPSWDGRRVAYQVKPNNSDEAELRVVEVDSGAVSERERVPGAKYATEVSWAPAGDGFYYTWIPAPGEVPAAERPGFAEIRFHRLGTDPAVDRLVRERTGDPSTFLGAELSRDGRWLVVTRYHGWSSTDVWFKDLEAGADGPWIPLAVGRPAIHAVRAHRGTFYVLTNDGAPRWRVLAVDPGRPARGAWREIVPEGEATIDGLAVAGGRLVLSLIEKATSRVEIRALDGSPLASVALPGLGKVSAVSGEEEGDAAFLSFESFTTPREIRGVDLATGATRVVFRPRVPVDPDRFETEQVFYASRDGTMVSMFLVRARGTKRDGGVPTLLHGYGGFQVPMLPVFSPRAVLWLEQGGLYAVPNLRGGNEYGERWHEGGMLLRKQNTFDDFLAAADWLVRSGWTRPGRLAAMGGSNGGLLVGAAMTQRPDPFAAVVCAVPLLDMVRYHLFGSGRTWVAEYGSARDPEQFRALLAYSPYHHVTPGTRYPSLLLLSADADDRVDPMHARKFAAAVQAASTGGPVLLRIERNAGHGGADLRRAEVEKTADVVAFLRSELSR